MNTLTPSGAARDARDALALIAGEQRWTFGQLAERARAVPVPDDTPLSFVGAPGVDAIAHAYAALEAGVAMMPLHPRWSAIEVERARAQVPASRLDAAAVLFTSGTSASPKGVLLPRRAFLASAAAHDANLPFERGDRWLLMMPIAHAGGLSIVTRALSSRTAVVAIDSFDPERALSEIVRQRVTLVSVVPAMLSALLDHDRCGALKLPRAVLVGGAALPGELRARAARGGVRVLASYGLTETCSQICTQRPGDRLDLQRQDSGRPLRGVELRVVDRRIQVRGPMLMAGYAGAAPLTPGAWFDTGDEGELVADGTLVVKGRADDTIVTGGENVHPAEVEDALRAQPGVRAVAVVGAPDARWGQVVTAVIVLEPVADVSAILDGASANLASFKRPRRVALVAALPLGHSGKVDRRALLRDLASGAITCSASRSPTPARPR